MYFILIVTINILHLWYPNKAWEHLYLLRAVLHFLENIHLTYICSELQGYEQVHLTTESEHHHNKSYRFNIPERSFISHKEES